MGERLRVGLLRYVQQHTHVRRGQGPLWIKDIAQLNLHEGEGGAAAPHVRGVGCCMLCTWAAVVAGSAADTSASLGCEGCLLGVKTMALCSAVLLCCLSSLSAVLDALSTACQPCLPHGTPRSLYLVVMLGCVCGTHAQAERMRMAAAGAHSCC